MAKLKKEYSMLTIEELKDYKSISQVSKELGYTDASYISRKVNKMGIGIRADELGLSFLPKGTLLLSPQDIGSLIKSLKKFNEKEEVN